ncbi:hypothetical protein [Raineyella sp.]|uniref:Phosphotyrosine protein phosphatase I domain-containing protein n=1 Tax=bioreactor metagenome TaxID=1076179 RepID=A0A644XMK7_9ZZZZ|nr:hypothetical protein [Raineyella sp.]MEA5155193.1 hypothetical protein [Raineyella sp.]
MSAPFRILTVCTGNICRSPAAEYLLRRALGPGVTVASAGTAALVDRPVDPPMADRLRADGLSTDGFHARYLVPALIEGADLVLAMTREHRAEVVTAVPRALGRTFTLTEYAALLDQWSEGGRPRPFYTIRVPDRLAEFTVAAARRRGTVRFADPGDYDVPDPFRAAEVVYDEAFRRISAAVDTVAAGLHAAGSAPREAGSPGSAGGRGASAATRPGAPVVPAPSAEAPWVEPGRPAPGPQESRARGLRRLFGRHRP